MIRPMTKIQLAVPAANYDNLVRWLQDNEIIHVAPLRRVPGASYEAPATDTAFKLATIQHALEFIERVKEERNLASKRAWRDLFARNPVASLEQLESRLKSLHLDEVLEDIREASTLLSKLAAARQEIETARVIHEPWQRLHVSGRDLQGTEHTEHALVTCSLAEELWLRNALNHIPTAAWQEVNRISDKRRGTVYLEVVVNRQDVRSLERLLTESTAAREALALAPEQTVVSYLADLALKQADLERRYTTELERATRFVEIESDLKLAYDALLHRQEREALHINTAQLPYVTALSGWLPTDLLPAFSASLQASFPAAAWEAVPPRKGETPPVAFRNSKFISPFEAVTNIYGKPRYNELDPSGPLSIFFLVAFALALSDAGYGLVMVLGTAAALNFFRLKRDLRQMLRLLFLTGVATIVAGALMGGWFGIVLEDLPASAWKDMLLALKVIDPVQSPLTLLGVAFALGTVQLLFAWAVKAYDLIRQRQYVSALLDGVAWITMVVSLMVWLAARQGILPAAWITPVLWLVYANVALLVLSQGRAHRNIFLRFGAGVLSLYGLVGFVSDVLSYSRLLALGLATGIIGLVVNLIGGMVSDMIPIVGVLLATLILVGGHVFNLGINALGAFIHSGRLQFVEFFPKFIEGGGVAYKPLGRVSKYVDNPREFM